MEMRQNVVEKHNRSHRKVLAPQSGAGLPWLHPAVSSRPCQSVVEVGPEKTGAASDQRWAGKYPYYPNLPPIPPWNDRTCGHAERGDHPKCQGRDAGEIFPAAVAGQGKQWFASATSHGHWARSRGSNPGGSAERGGKRMRGTFHSATISRGCRAPCRRRPVRRRLMKPGRWLL
jgi:hypothetical protein